MQTPRLLLVEDDQSLREMLTEYLTEEGFEVVAASDGRAALEAFASQGPFDVVLTDHQLPHVSGLDLLAELRRQGQTVPVVVMSGNLQLTRRQQAALGVGRVMRKPVHLPELLKRLRREMTRHG